MIPDGKIEYSSIFNWENIAFSCNEFLLDIH